MSRGGVTLQARLGFCLFLGMKNKQSIAFGFLRFAGRFYKWAFTNIFRLVRKSDEHIKAIEARKRAEVSAQGSDALKVSDT
jgi:hypothetical protein